MNARALPLLLAVALLAGGAGGYLLSSRLREAEGPKARWRQLELEREAAGLHEEVDRLLAKGIDDQQRILKLTRRLEDAEARRQPSATEAAPRPVRPGRASRTPDAYRLTSASEADRYFEAAMKRGDARPLLGLGAALLGMGEEGFEKIIDLLERTRTTQGGEAMFRNPLLIGPFLRALADNQENLLRFGLFLRSKEPAELPKGAADLREELFTRELGNVLLGFYDGDDPEVRAGFFEDFQSQLEASPSGSAIRGLAQIPGDEATDLLIELIDLVPENLLDEVVLALAYRGDGRALTALEALSARTGDRDLKLAVDSAIEAIK